jgi:hypothetical protein
MHDLGDRLARHLDVDVLGDLEHDLVLVDLDDVAVDPADRHDLVTRRQLGEQVLGRPLLRALRTDEQEVHDREHRDQEDQEAATLHLESLLNAQQSVRRSRGIGEPGERRLLVGGELPSLYRSPRAGGHVE